MLFSYYEKIGDEVACIDDEMPFAIPQAWAWCRLGTCCKKKIKRGKAPKYASSGNTLVFAQKCNTKYDGIRLELAQFLDENTLRKYPEDEYLQDGDIVINSTGTGTLGRIGLFRSSDNKQGLPIVPDSHVTVIRADEPLIDGYLYFVIKNYQAFLEEAGEGSTNQKELRPEVISELFVPIPPVKEQLRIVDHANTLFSELMMIEGSLN